MSVRNIVKSIQDIMRQDVGVDGDAQRISQLCWMFFLKIIDDQDQELELLDSDYRSPLPKKLQWRTWAADPEGITGDGLTDFVNGELFPALKALTTRGSSDGGTIPWSAAGRLPLLKTPCMIQTTCLASLTSAKSTRPRTDNSCCSTPGRRNRRTGWNRCPKG